MEALLLELLDIKKQYFLQDQTVDALKGLNIKFRETEFVSILGQSGCGKTTLLNIIGGLDKYSSGDLIINGVSTKNYTDKDWDIYRNHKIGFIFQSYNLIPHLTVLENVELALTLSGIHKEERRNRAKEALEMVGIGDKIKYKPNQLSGGQMHRVAIARALVNNPDIILADEPTGALDSKTSVQIMEILKEISANKLIIMVTHNPELAEQYSTRIIKLLDGSLLSDSNPYEIEVCDKEEDIKNGEQTTNSDTLEISANLDNLDNKDKKTTQEDIDNNKEQNEKIETEHSEVDAQDNACSEQDKKYLEEESENVIAVSIEEDTVKDKKCSKNSEKGKKERTKMSFFTALSLSFKNLLTKKARTMLVSFAGSIGIIGIALILSLSSGFQAYIDMVQKDTLSTYPVQLTNSSYNMASLMQIFLSSDSDNEHNNNDKVYTKQELTDMLEKFNSSSTKSDLKSFKAHIEGDVKEELDKYISAIQYVYNINVNAYYQSDVNGLISANATTVFADIINSYPKQNLTTNDMMLRYSVLSMMFGSSSSYYSNEFWSEMIDNKELLKSQYELVGEGSKWAQDYNEIMIVVDKNNQISDYTLYGLGLLDQQNLEKLLDDYINNRNSSPVTTTFEFEDILNLEYKIILEPDYFELQPDNTYLDIRLYNEPFIQVYSPQGELTQVQNPIYNAQTYQTKLQNLYDTKGVTIKVAGIIKEKEGSTNQSIGTVVAYNSSLTEYIITNTQNHPLVQSQLQNSTTNVLTNAAFNSGYVEAERNAVLSNLGYADLDDPTGIYIYPINFEAKKNIENIISNYNDNVVAAGEEDKVITYTDAVGTMMESVTTIVSAITYVLIAFVAISLIVSSIMIGIITYISVLERTKEIGVLRSIGASKRDIKNVFVSESVIIGFIAGVLGIVVTLILNIPINIIINSLTGLANVAILPWVAAVVLIAISVFLTFIAGLIPARIASKKDPVIALRTE